MKRRNAISVLLYLLGVALFVTANSSVVSGSPIHLTYFQRVVLCGAAVCSIGTAPFIFCIKLDMNFDYLFRSSYMPV